MPISNRTERLVSRHASGRNWLENVVTPWWIKIALPMATWRLTATGQKKIYLTFDDGPTNQMTDHLLTVLKQFDARATFFCIGQHVEQEKSRLAAMVDQGHLIGNHGYSHLNGWKTSTQPYVADILRCQEVLSDVLGHAPKYFRPPYGRISLNQMFQLRGKFSVVMWDILSMDYREDLTGQEVAQNVTHFARSGSIVLMHDSQLAAERVIVALPQILKHFSESGFQFCTLGQ